MFAKIGSGLQALGRWCKTTIEETPGVASTSRVVALIACFVIFGVLIQDWRLHHVLPDRDTLTGLAILLSAAVGGYGLNKLSGLGGGDDKG